MLTCQAAIENSVGTQPWQGPCDLCRTRSPRDLALGLPVVYEHCTYISRLARCALSKIGLAGDVEGSYGLLLPLLICLYVLTYFRPVPHFFAYYTAVLLEMEACPVFQWRWRRPLPVSALILLPHFYDVVPSEMSFVLVTWEFKASRLCCIKQVPP